MRRSFPLILIGALAVAIWGLKSWRSGPSASVHANSISPPVTRAPYDPALTHQTVEFWAAQVRGDPQGSTGLSNLAQWYLRSFRETGDIADILRAEKAARRSLAIRPHNYPPLVELARCLMTQHLFAQALVVANKAAALNPIDTPARSIQAECYMELGNYQAAHAVLGKNPLEPDDTNGKALYARLAELEGNPQGALALLSKAQSEADKNLDMPCESVAWYHMRVGNVLGNMGRAQAAEQAYREALALFPGDYRSMTALAKLEAGRGDWQGAIQWGQQAAAIVPTPEIIALIGDAQAALGHKQEAARQYQLVEAIGKLDRSQGVIYDRQRALFYADHNRHLDEALALSSRELKNRQDIYAYDTYAWACYKNGLTAKAQTAMRQALAHHTQDASLYFHAGMIAYARGDKATAKSDLTRALKLNPYFHPFEPHQARTILAKLS